ncbi:MAG: hypothetical protein M1828_006414 [Chrysothrix sp. TS-e1954]|nr:MAG: hypothetical protein M1828_006414 [Chrysothrix sp. TS-e1954]
MAETSSASESTKKRFEPKTPVQLDPPKSDPISLEYLEKCNGACGRVFDVSGNKAYGPEGGYKGMPARRPPLSAQQPIAIKVHTRLLSISANAQVGVVADRAPSNVVFAGHDASRALGKSSLKPEDVRAEWEDLDEKEKQILDEWEVYFSKRYNIVGIIEGASNLA